MADSAHARSYNGNGEADPSPQAKLHKWRNAPPDADDSDSIKEGLMLVVDVVEANLEQSIKNGNAIETLQDQVEAGGKLSQACLATTRAYQAELNALKVEVAETKTIAEAIAAHLNLRVSG